MHRRRSIFTGMAVAVAVLGTATAGNAGRDHVLRPAAAFAGTPAAAPFADAWAQVPRTTAARRAANVVVFGAEQDIDGFNANLSCCNQLWSTWMGGAEALRGAFNQNPKGEWFKDLVTAATATKTTLSYTISPKANWYWGGKKVPVTYRDFVYTVQQIDNPDNLLAGRTGYSNIDPTRFTHKGDKQVTFFWKTKNCSADFPCGAFANWESLFSPGSLYPSFALKGLDFNKIWTSCICGYDGKPVSNGPYYLSNYTKGQGAVLKANPFWAGKKPAIQEVDFKIITDTNSEALAMRGGEVDAISPTFGLYLQPLKDTPGVTFNQIPGYYFEHLEFREGSRKAGDGVTKGASNALLAAPWFRQAIALGLDRQSIINTIYGAMTGSTKPLNNAVFYATHSAYKPDFAKWNFNADKARSMMAKHCTGGPSSVDPSNTKIWTCAGLPATINWSWTSGNSVRATSEAIAKAQLRAVGIQVNDRPLPANVIFGSAGLPSGDFDVAEFALITTGDPGDWYDSWRCQGAANWTGYCSSKVDTLLKAGNAELDPAKRIADFQQADAIMADTVPVFPLYQRPTPLIYKSNLLGMVNNPAIVGPFWNVEYWHWK